MREPTAAEALYPHLKQAIPEPVVRRTPPNSVQDAMYPSLSQEGKAHVKPNPRRESQRRLLRELRIALQVDRRR
jgi:hypothetical protein